MNKIADLPLPDYSNREKIMALAHNDALVMSVLRMAEFQGLDWTSTLELLVLQLGEAKKTLLDNYTETLQNAAFPQKVYITTPKIAKQIKKELDR